MKYQVKGMEYHDTYFVSHLRLARQQFLTCDGEGSHHAIRKGLQIMNRALTGVLRSRELCHNSLVVMPFTGHPGERELGRPTDLHSLDITATNGEALTRGPSFLLDVLHLSSSILCGRHEDLGVGVAWSSGNAREQQRDEHQLHCHLRFSSVKQKI